MSAGAVGNSAFSLSPEKMQKPSDAFVVRLSGSRRSRRLLLQNPVSNEIGESYLRQVLSPDFLAALRDDLTYRSRVPVTRCRLLPVPSFKQTIHIFRPGILRRLAIS